MEGETAEVLEAPEGTPALYVPPGSDILRPLLPGEATEGVLIVMKDIAGAIRRDLWLAAALAAIGLLLAAPVIGNGYRDGPGGAGVLYVLGSFITFGVAANAAVHTWRLRARKRRFAADARAQAINAPRWAVAVILVFAIAELAAPFAMATFVPLAPRDLDVQITNWREQGAHVQLMVWGERSEQIHDGSYDLPPFSSMTTGVISTEQAEFRVIVAVDGSWIERGVFENSWCYGGAMVLIENDSIIIGQTIC